MKKRITILVVLFLGFMLIGCGDDARYLDKVIEGRAEFIFKCLENVPTGGDTEGEDAVSSCERAADRSLTPTPGFYWWNVASASKVGPWKPCSKATRPEEREACQYVEVIQE